MLDLTQLVNELFSVQNLQALVAQSSDEILATLQKQYNDKVKAAGGIKKIEIKNEEELASLLQTKFVETINGLYSGASPASLQAIAAFKEWLQEQIRQSFNFHAKFGISHLLILQRLQNLKNNQKNSSITPSALPPAVPAKKIKSEKDEANPSEQPAPVKKIQYEKLTQKELLKCFIDAEKEREFLSSDILAKLNFKSLPQLIMSLNATDDPWSQVSPKVAENVLAKIYEAQYMLQEKQFSFAAFFASVFYGLFYYGLVIGIALHFILPMTRPTNIYRMVKEAQQPPEVVREPMERLNLSMSSERNSFSEAYSYVALMKKTGVVSDAQKQNLSADMPLSEVFLTKQHNLKEVQKDGFCYMTPYAKYRLELKGNVAKNVLETEEKMLKEKGQNLFLNRNTGMYSAMNFPSTQQKENEVNIDINAQPKLFEEKMKSFFEEPQEAQHLENKSFKSLFKEKAPQELKTKLNESKQQEQIHFGTSPQNNKR